MVTSSAGMISPWTTAQMSRSVRSSLIEGVAYPPKNCKNFNKKVHAWRRVHHVDNLGISISGLAAYFLTV